MLRATGIIWTVDKHSILSTLHGGGGAGEQFVMKCANRPSIFGQDCTYSLTCTKLKVRNWPRNPISRPIPNKKPSKLNKLRELLKDKQDKDDKVA